jgi:hypothetical protein
VTWFAASGVLVLAFAVFPVSLGLMFVFGVNSGPQRVDQVKQAI